MGHESLEPRLLLANNLGVRFDFTNTSGTPVSTLHVGDDFLVRVFVKDLRAAPAGVFQAFMDVNYSSALASPRGTTLTAGPLFGVNASGTLSAGLADEAGGVDSDQVPPNPLGAEELLFSIPLHADATGTLNITADLAETPSKQILFFDSATGVLLSDIVFSGGTITIDPAGTGVAGVTVNPQSGLSTAEAGGTATFTMALTKQPTANVTIALSSSDTTEGTVSTSSVVFTAANWSTPQTITITGVDDQLDDGDIAYMIVTAPASSSDASYNGLNAADVSLTNTDNDSTAIVVAPTSGLVTTESGGTATFQISLGSQPTANVTIGLSSSDATEGTVSVNSMVFTPANWNTPQTVTISGVDDQLDDGDVPYTIVTAAASSSDTSYNGMNAADVAVTNTDNDAAAILVAPTSGLVTSESAGTATFQVSLGSQPSANVTIGLSSSDTTEGTISLSSVVFTPANWNAPQTITITGVDDQLDDGDIAYMIVTAAATSSDTSYNGLNAVDVGVTNTDNDAPGILVAPTSGLVTTESAGTATFQMSLASQPTANVTIGLSSSDTTEGTVSLSSAVFTPANWNTPQTVTITGVDDPLDDGDIAYMIVTAAATSSDTSYNGLNAADVAVTNTDNDAPGILVAPTSGLVTTESGGAATFQITLGSQPTGNVTIGLSSSDTTEGTVSVSSVVFTPANWNSPQTVTITGVDDLFHDNDVAYTIITAAASSSDPSYNGMNVADISVTNTDNDTPGIIVAPISGLVTTEAGGTAMFQVSLSSQPTATVTIGISSSDTTEGTVSTPSLAFTTANWNTPQTVTITGVQDLIDDGDVAYSIITAAATSTDSTYNGLNAADVSVSNMDDDVAGVQVAPTSGLITSEAGGTATFTLVLTTQPTANVTIGLASSDATEGIVGASSAVFTPANWNTPQTITITGVDDAVDDGDIAYMIVTTATSTDPTYNNRTVADVQVTNTDNDAVGILVTPTSGLTTTEAGGTAAFTIVLASQPTSNVTIGLASSDTTEGTVAPVNVVFTSANWNSPQTVTITGVNDTTSDGDIAYTIVTAAATSNDSGYSGLNAVDVAVSNLDDDAPQVLVSPTSGLATTEAGGTATFQVTLSRQPNANVTVPVSSSVTSEGTVSTSSLLFTSANWNTPQTVTITGVDDAVVDGDRPFTVVLGAATSTDAAFQGIDGPDVSVSNQDNDTATIEISDVSIAEGTGAGDTQLVFQVQLSAAVASAFSVPFTIADGTAKSAEADYTASNGGLSFTGQAGEMHTITVTVHHDAVVEGDETLTAVLGAATGLPANLLSRLTIDSVPAVGTIINDDQATLAIAPVAVDEGTGAGTTPLTFTVTLSAAVQGGLTVDYQTNNGTATVADGDYVDNDGMLTFAGTAGETRTITVQIVRDDVVEGDETLQVALSNLAGLPAGAIDDVTLSGSPATGTIRDDDLPRLVLEPIAASQAEGTGTGTTAFTYRVRLMGEVIDADGFDISYFVDDGTAKVADGDYTDNDGTLHFTGVDGQSQTITIQVAQDALVEGDETFAVRLGALSGLASGQTVLFDTTPLDATIVDDDDASLTLTVDQASQVEGTGAGQTDFTFTVTLSAAVQGGFRVPYTTSDGTAKLANNDYVDNDGELSFAGAAGESRTFVVHVNQDDLVEANETFTTALGTLLGIPAATLSHVQVMGSPLTATITNDDTATLTLTGGVSQAEGTGAGTTTYTYTVTLTGKIEGGLAVPYQINDGTATAADGDYVDHDDSLMFTGSDGESHDIVVAVAQDDKVELDETFSVALAALNVPAEVLQAISVTGGPLDSTIVNDDSATLTLGTLAATLEGTGTAGAFLLSVTLSHPVQGGFTVPYSVADGTATLADGDFTGSGGTLTFAGTAGEIQQIDLHVNPDNRVEADETASVSLGALGSIDSALAALLQVDAGPRTITILNDETATVAFVSGSTQVLEASGTATANVRLSVTGGGTLSAPIVVQVAATGGTAAAGADFTLATTSITFPAGAADGDLLPVQLTLVDDQVLEMAETVDLALTITDPGVAGAVALGAQSTNVVTITDDPRTASIVGAVWIDADNDGVRDPNEVAVPGVSVRLTGIDLQGNNVEIATMTGADGLYAFTNLPGGTYEVRETQSAVLIDGREVLGVVNGTPVGTAEADAFVGIVLPPAASASGYLFGEFGLYPQYVNARMFLNTTIPMSTQIQTLIANQAQLAGDSAAATVIRQGLVTQVRRIGDEVSVLGGAGNDRIQYTPAAATTSGQHQLVVNGQTWQFDPQQVTKFRFDGGGGTDIIELHDSPGNDTLGSNNGALFLQGTDYRADVIAAELVRAISAAGGDDHDDTQTLDTVLELSGPWI